MRYSGDNTYDLEGIVRRVGVRTAYILYITELASGGVGILGAVEWSCTSDGKEFTEYIAWSRT